MFFAYQFKISGTIKTSPVYCC